MHGSARAKCLGFSERCIDFYRKPGRRALVQEFYEMNCGEDIREHLLVERMKRWLTRARYRSISNGCARWRARRNFWFLVRKYRALAERHGLRETDVF